MLVSLYRVQNDRHRDKLEAHFTEAWTHFATGNPVKKVTFLQDKLIQVEQLERK